MNTQLKPLHDKILVRRIEVENKTPGGIIIPGSAKEKPDTGEVVAVGTGHRNKDGTSTPLSVTPGDKILFAKHGGVEISVGAEDFLLMEEQRVLGIFQ